MSALPRRQPPERRRQRAPPEHPEHREPVLGTGAHRAGGRAGIREDRLEDRPLASPGAPGSARTPVASTRSSGLGPDTAVGDAHGPGRVHAAGEGHRREVVAAPPGPPLVGAGDPVRGQRDLERRHQLARGEGRHAGPDEEVVERDPARSRPGPRPRRPPRGRAAPAPCPPRATRCTCCPARVARLRIWTEPTTAAASASAARSRRITGCAAISVIVVVAPITSGPPSPPDPGRELRDPLDVDDERRARPSRRAGG